VATICDIIQRKPSVNGCTVEQSCLSAIESLGLHYGKLHWEPIRATTFDGDIVDCLPIGDKDSRSLFIPDDPFFKHIDALYLTIDVKAKTVFVAPIQVTISKRPKHQKSEPLFYAKWAQWQEHYRGFRISTTFVWIVDDIPSWQHVEGKWRNVRSGVHVVDPTRESVSIPLANVYPPLADILAGTLSGTDVNPEITLDDFELKLDNNTSSAPTTSSGAHVQLKATSNLQGVSGPEVEAQQEQKRKRKRKPKK
jgi:hypothetical protein